MSTQPPYDGYDFGHFVAGADEYGMDCGTKLCPAKAAGYSTSTARSPSASLIAHEYDAVLREWAADDDEDVEVLRYRPPPMDDEPSTLLIDEEVAKKAWFQAIANVKRADESSRSKDLARGRPVCEVTDAQIEAGEAVARELDWLGADESVGPETGFTIS